MSNESYFQLTEKCACELYEVNGKHELITHCNFHCSDNYSNLSKKCGCGSYLDTNKQCYADAEKAVNLAVFKKLNQSIPGFDLIYKCIKHESNASVVRCGIAYEPFASNNLELNCMYKINGIIKETPTIYVPKLFLSKYKMEEEVVRKNPIAIVSVLLICMIGFISFIFYWKYGKKKLNKFLRDRDRRNDPSASPIKMRSKLIYKGNIDGTEQRIEV